jgi:membrane-associated phospholipid phosphatase
MSSQLASTNKQASQHENCRSLKKTIRQFTLAPPKFLFRRAICPTATAKDLGTAGQPHRPVAYTASAPRRRALLICLGAGMAALSPAKICLSGQLADALSTRTAGVSRRDQSVTIYWNQLARELVELHSVDPPRASRLYALLSIAQHDAALSNHVAKGATSSATRPSDYLQRLRIEGASRAVLSELLHGDLDYTSEFRFRDSYPTLTTEELESAYQSGHATALQLLKQRQDDGSDDARQVVPPTGLYAWRSPQNEPPVRPRWGYVRPLAVTNIADFVPGRPFLDPKALDWALDEVRRASSNATTHERELIQTWADGAGTSTPPGHWNAIAAGLIAERRPAEITAAQTLSLVNIALMDAGIACWLTKYTYWIARPNQLDPNIKPLIPVPNFPSYTSGHSAFSAAAARVLGHIFPEKKDSLRTMAEQAALSRLYAGIHFGFDVNAGLLQGDRIANAVIFRYRNVSPLQPRIL